LLNRFFYISRLQNAGWSRDRCGKICVSWCLGILFINIAWINTARKSII
jgi:hypothetical protein